MNEYYEVINIVYVYPEQKYGTVEKLGAYASLVRYNSDGIEVEELMDNEDFVILEEIVFEHVEEDN